MFGFDFLVWVLLILVVLLAVLAVISLVRRNQKPPEKPLDDDAGW